jgi:hypothetical protein
MLASTTVETSIEIPTPPLNSGVVDIEYIVRVQSTGVVSGNVETVALEDAIGAVLYVDGLQ